MTGVRAVFFDAVGTVLVPDPGVVAVYAAAVGRYGVDPDPAGILARFRAAYIHEEEIDRANGWVTDEDREVARWRAIVAAALPGSPVACFDELYEHFARPNAWRVPVDAPPLFARLAARGIMLGLASNYDSRLDVVVAGRPELAVLAGRVVVSSRVGVRKPGRAFFDAVVEAAGCGADEVALVGDDVGNDFEGATAAGLRAVLLDPAGRYPHVSPRVAALGDLVL